MRSTGYREDGTEVLDYARWVMVRKRDERAPRPIRSSRRCRRNLPPDAIGNNVPLIDPTAWDDALSGSSHRWGDYAVGERIDHVDGTTIEEAEHQMACRLFQNTAKVHFNSTTEGKGRFGRRLVYGGHVISTARALTFNGLGNAFAVAAVNGGRHVAPPSRATRSTPGRRSWTAARFRVAATSAPCASASSRPRTSAASTSPTGPPKARRTPPWCSISTGGC